MKHKSYVWQFIGWTLVIAIPVGALMLVSTSNAAPKGSTTGPKPEPKAAGEVPKSIVDYFRDAGPADGGTLAQWFSHIGTTKGILTVWWIRIDEFLADATTEVNEDDIAVTYRGRFRWTVMLPDNKTPLATDETIERATATAGLGSGLRSVLEEEAHALAIGQAADAAARWLDTNFGGKLA